MNWQGAVAPDAMAAITEEERYRSRSVTVGPDHDALEVRERRTSMPVGPKPPRQRRHGVIQVQALVR